MTASPKLFSQVGFEAFDVGLVFGSVQVLLEGEDMLEPYKRDALNGVRRLDERVNVEKLVPAVEYLHITQAHDSVAPAAPFDRAELSSFMPSPVSGNDVYVVDFFDESLRQ